MEHKFTHPYDQASTHITPLALAVVFNQKTITELLLSHGASTNTAIANTGSTPLHLACRYGSVASVSLLLSEGAKVNASDQNGVTPLQTAILCGQVEIVSSLLDAKAEIQEDGYQTTVFLLAAMHGQLDVAKLLLKRGQKSQLEEVNSIGNRPLHLACLNGHLNHAKWLLGLGVPIESIGGSGGTPLHWACVGGSKDVVEMLLKEGANIQATNSYMNTPFLLACANAHPNIVEVLGNHGALIDDVNKDGDNCFHHLVNSSREFSKNHRILFAKLKGLGGNIDQKNCFGHTPLFIACRDRQPKHVSRLFDLDADVNVTARIGATALMEASCTTDNTEVMELLLSRQADVTITNNHGLTALSLACHFGILQNVRILLQHELKAQDQAKSQVTHRDNSGHSALFAAAESESLGGESVEVALELIKTTHYYPANPLQNKSFTETPSDGTRVEKMFLKNFQRVKNSAPDSFQSLIYWAIANGQLELLAKCFEHEPQAIHWTRGGVTWLHIAVQHGQDTAMREHLSEAEVFAKPEDGTTALHLAASNGNLSASQFLLDLVAKKTPLEKKRARVAAITELNTGEESALSLAIRGRHKDVEDFFWSELREFGTANRQYATDYPDEAKTILETVAEWEKPGLELVLKHLIREWFPAPSNVETGKWTALHWAVHSSQAEAVWWLLSKGGYSFGTAIEKVQTLVQPTGVGKLIQGLLEFPPSLLDHVGNPDDDRPPQLPEPTDPNHPSLHLKGNIVDVLSDGKKTGTPYVEDTIRGMIYDEGPQSLMKTASSLDKRHLDVFKRGLREAEGNPISAPANFLPLVADMPQLSGSALPVRGNQERVKSSLENVTANLKLRWIHLPVNDVRLGS